MTREEKIQRMIGMLTDMAIQSKMQLGEYASNELLDCIYEAIKVLEQELLAKGKWMKVRPFKFQMHDYECSKCLGGVDIKTPYCPMCGSKMDGIFTDMRGEEE